MSEVTRTIAAAGGRRRGEVLQPALAPEDLAWPGEPAQEQSVWGR
jgi:hypothetical protein